MWFFVWLGMIAAVVGIIFILAVIITVIACIPDINRYLKMRQM